MALIQHKRRLNPTVTLMEVSAPLIAKRRSRANSSSSA